VSNTAGSAGAPILNLGLTNSTIVLSVANGRTNMSALNLIIGGTSNLINIAALPAINIFPAQFSLIKYAPPMRGVGYNFVLGSVPLSSTYAACLSNNLANPSVDLVIVPRPAIVRIDRIGANLVFSGTNGIAGSTYYVLASSNLVLPAAGWTRLATNAFDSAGNFQFTNALNANQPQYFYRLEVR